MVDEEDLRLVKLAAEREGKPEAELIRRAFHLVAMSTRSWDEPFFERSLDFGGPVREEEIREAVAETVAGKRGAAGNAA
ncbi:hypothetical protein Mth01_20210 [Sphaerimonospora thailandensis]|uniref:Ribbon-helix-helix CopG family protein n=2 Tax=Sphaerimonospora thailandensis TaxID=795644 RepID=A0A8J3VZ76_9ACTN|nr:hypothetical protein Mth01_20210 [Sphaerimonospora thailandensis]